MIVNSAVNHIINILKYIPLSGSSYIKLSKKLDQQNKDLINIQNNDDSECFKWCLVRCFHLADHNRRGIRKVEKNFVRELHLKIQNFLSKLEMFITLKKRVASLLVLLVMKIRKNIQSVSRNIFKRHVVLLLI